MDRVEAAVDVALRRHHVHEAGLRDHEALLDAMEARDPARAETLMRSHIDSMIAEVEATTSADADLLDRLLAWNPTATG